MGDPVEPGVRETWARFEDFVGRVMDVEQVPGMSVAFACGGRIIYARGFGWQDRERGVPARVATIYGAASITKSLTAVAILQLQEAGKLSVADPVRKHLPDFRVPDSQATDRITVHHLLTHTSGLPPLAFRKQTPKTAGELLDRLANSPYRLLGEPGTIFSYSNEGYALLGVIIERASGVPFSSYVEQRILEPLGMRNSTADTAALERFPDVTRLYAREDDAGRVVPAPGWNEWGPYAASGALRSNVLDLLQYLSRLPAEGDPGRQGGPGRRGGLSGQRLLDPGSVALMRTRWVEYLPGTHYGYGWQIRSLAGGLTAEGHSGNSRGVGAYAGCVPEKGIAGVVLANLSRIAAADVWEAGVRTILGMEPATEPLQPRETAPAGPASGVDWNEYTGVYRSEQGVELRIWPREDGGIIAACEGIRGPARWIGPDCFEIRIRTRRERFVFLRAADGSIPYVRYHQRVLQRVAP